MLEALRKTCAKEVESLAGLCYEGGWRRAIDRNSGFRRRACGGKKKIQKNFNYVMGPRSGYPVVLGIRCLFRLFLTAKQIGVRGRSEKKL